MVIVTYFLTVIMVMLRAATVGETGSIPFKYVHVYIFQKYDVHVCPDCRVQGVMHLSTRKCDIKKDPTRVDCKPRPEHSAMAICPEPL